MTTDNDNDNDNDSHDDNDDNVDNDDNDPSVSSLSEAFVCFLDLLCFCNKKLCITRHCNDDLGVLLREALEHPSGGFRPLRENHNPTPLVGREKNAFFNLKTVKIILYSVGGSALRVEKYLVERKPRIAHTISEHCIVEHIQWNRDKNKLASLEATLV